MLGNAKHFVTLPLGKMFAKIHILSDIIYLKYYKNTKNDKIKRKH